MIPGRPLNTFGRRHRWHRDCALWLAHKGGMSQRQLSLAFLLSRARVQRILEELEELAATRRGPKSGRGPILPRGPGAADNGPASPEITAGGR